MIPEYEKRITDLKNKLYQYVTVPNKSIISTNYILNNHYYLAIAPVLILLLLLIFRPMFIYDQKLDVKKINYLKIIKFTLIGGIIIDIGLFLYFKRFMKR
jgi:hypothetical protein